jgi:membrane associated rhomboid family serine protease
VKDFLGPSDVQTGGVAYVAHIGGFAFGAYVARVMAARRAAL